MKKNVLFALIALFCVSSSAWAQYVKLTAPDGTVSWIEIKGKVDGTNIEIYKSDYSSAIDKNTSGAIDLWNVWSESGERGTHYRVTGIVNRGDLLQPAEAAPHSGSEYDQYWFFHASLPYKISICSWQGGSNNSAFSPE